MKRKTTRFLSIVVCFMLLVSAVACGGGTKDTEAPAADAKADSSTAPASEDKKEAAPAEQPKVAGTAAAAEPNVLPVSKDNITMTLYMGMATGSRQVHNSSADVPVVKEMMKQTGINFKFVHPPENDDGSFFTTMIASGDYPDLIQNNFDTYPGGPDGAMEDGVIINMNDLIYKYAPNYLGFLEKYGEEVRRRVLSDKGTVVRFGTIFNPPFLEGRVHGGLIARADLLKKYNLEIPETYDEYEKMFETFKQNGIAVPLSIPNSKAWQFPATNVLAAGFGVTHQDFQMKDGKITYSRTLPEYKEYIAKLADWYKKGYISSDFLNSGEVDSQKVFNSGRAGAVLCGTWQIITMENVGRQGNPDFAAVGLPYPRKAKGDKVANANFILLSVDSRAWFVSAKSKYQKEAVKLIDYLYMPETMRMTAWGVNTSTETLWEEKDGKRTFTDFMKKNPDFDFGIARDRYTINAMQVMWDEEMEIQQYDYPVVQEAWKNWANNTDNSGCLPQWVTLTADESRQLAEVMSQINTYGDEMVAKFITGAEPIENFDAFVSQLKSLNIDKAIEIKQAGYDRFLKRK